MNFKWIFLPLSFSSLVASADCAVLEPRPCVKIKFEQAIDHGKKNMCVGKVSVAAGAGASVGVPAGAGKSKESLSVFFLECPKVGKQMQGDLVQRSDITLEDMAPCQYELKPNPNCGKPGNH